MRAPARAAGRADEAPPQGPGRPSAGPALASAAALLVVLVLLAPLAQAQSPPRHLDPRTVPSDDEAVRSAGGAVLASSEQALENLTEAPEAPGAARSHADNARGLALMLALAAEIPSQALESAELLDRLAPPAGDLGESVAAIAAGLLDARSSNAPGAGADRSAAERLGALQDAREAVPRARQAADGFDDLGYDTRHLRELLDELLEVIREQGAEIARQSETSRASGGTGEQATDEEPPEPTRLVARPDPVRFDQRLDVLVLAPEANDTVEVQAFGNRRGLTADENGLARARVPVPWAAQRGEHPIQASWPDGRAETEVTVVRLPTRLEEVQARAQGDRILVQARLLAAGQPAAGAPIQVGDEPFETARTDDRGHVALALPADGADAVPVRYPGNRTHEPALASAELPSPAPAADPATAEASPEPPAAPEPDGDGLPWTLVALAVGSVAAGLAAHRYANRSRPRPATDARPEAGGPVAGLPADHPLSAVLEGEGYDPTSLTLRQAADVWAELGAPDVHAWARRHERAYYGAGREVPDLPASLISWAEGRRRRSR